MGSANEDRNGEEESDISDMFAEEIVRNTINQTAKAIANSENGSKG